MLFIYIKKKTKRMKSFKGCQRFTPSNKQQEGKKTVLSFTREYAINMLYLMIFVHAVLYDIVYVHVDMMLLHRLF